MKSINQEEYEVLKSYISEEKYIAKDRDGSIRLLTDYPEREMKREEWSDGWGKSTLKNSANNFKFIKWEDEGPHNITELIEGYESEETKVNKDLEWLKDEVLGLKKNGNTESNQTEAEKEMGRLQKWAWDNCADRVYELIDQLDEPEVLSQEITYGDALKVIAENIDTDEFSIGLYLEALSNNEKYEFLTEKWVEDNTSPVDEEGRLFVWKRDLQNVIVPKGEQPKITESDALNKIAKSYPLTPNDIPWILDRYVANVLVEQPALPVIPQFVADWIECLKSKKINLLENIYDFTHDEDINNYIREQGNALMRAWVVGYEVAGEQKYYVMNNDNRMMLVRMMDGKTITEADPFKLEDMYEVEKKSHRLTEQEIKDYDPRFWPFVVKVEELEE